MKYTVSLLKSMGECAELRQKGIFLIRFIPTPHIYISSTNRSFRVRWKEIRKEARNLNNTKISRVIRELWQSYDEDGFEFEVLEITDSLVEREQFYIDFYQPSLNSNKISREVKLKY
jgi:hypothetical protein